MKKTFLLFACLLMISFLKLSAQQLIRGTVRDDKGPLEGASVLLKNTTTGSMTNASGSYSIAASSGDTLVFSYSGYPSREAVVGTGNTLDINMTSEAKGLEEVVVVGYGTKKRQFLTGAVSSVGKEPFEARPVLNAYAALQGEVPGVVIQRSSGQPGNEGFQLNVRGYASANGSNSPLVLIDGVAGSLDLLNPEDIESISVLKDAAASIYGARAAGGVFIVTTKKGKRGTPKVTYGNNFAVSKLAGMMESPTHYEMAIMDNEANIHNGAVPMYTPEMLEKVRNNDPNPIPHPIYAGWMLFFTSTDWLEETFENGFQQEHNLNVSGGGNNSAYYLSGSFSDQQGVIRYAQDNNKRYNLRLNYDYDLFKWLKLESKVAFEHQHRTDIGGLGTWVITEAIFGMPNHPVYTPAGNFFAQGGWGNAVAQAKEAETATFDKRNINTNFKAIATIIPELKLHLQTGINFGTEKWEDRAKPVPLYKWDETIAYYTIANPGESKLTLTNVETIYKNFTGYLEYQKLIGGKHDIGIMAGVAHEENDYEWFNASRQNLVTDDVWSLNLGTQNYQADGRGEDWAIRSLFSRINYTFNNKYMFEANLRYDGSSRFHPDKRWGFFPGLSAAWRISQENFMEGISFFDDVKIRASYGQTGNQEISTDGNAHLYDYIQLINIGGSYPFGPGGQVQSATLAGMASPNRTWETVVTKNIGIDLAIFSSRLNFTFDYFQKRNKDMLIPVTYPSMLGAVAPYTNSGELLTKGFETTLGWSDRIGKLSYNARFILSDSKNEVVDYGGQDTYVVGLNMIRQGYPINTYFAYVFDGVIRNQKELDDYKVLGGVPSDISIGDAKFRDVNGDGTISAYGDHDDGDVINVGNITPRYNFGINLGARYSNFDLVVFIQGVGKRTIFREGDYSLPWTDWWRQPPQFYYGKTWNEDRPNAEYPRLSHGNIRYWNYQQSTLQEINGAYARLKNLQIGYTLPVSLTLKASISRARIYFSGQDLWEKHHVKGGWDPESERWGFNYPFQRMYSFGVDVTFN